MKKGSLYTIVFMFVISAVFTGLLAFANSYFKPKIESNTELALKKSILYLFNLPIPESTQEMNVSFESNIESRTINDMEVFVYKNEDGIPNAYAFEFSAAGLWGTITGYVAVSSDFDKLIGVEFTSHSETPGLGGRIDEIWFKEQFRGAAIKLDVEVFNPSEPDSVDRFKGPLTYAAQGEEGIDAITGATSTSNAVIGILNTIIQQDIAILQEVVQ